MSARSRHIVFLILALIGFGMSVLFFFRDRESRNSFDIFMNGVQLVFFAIWAVINFLRLRRS